VGGECEHRDVGNLLKNNHTSWANCLRQMAQNGNGIRNKLQNEAPDSGIKKFAV